MTDENIKTKISFNDKNIRIDTDFTSETSLSLSNSNGRLDIFLEGDAIKFSVDREVIFQWPNNDSSKLDKILEYLKEMKQEIKSDIKLWNA